MNGNPIGGDLVSLSSSDASQGIGPIGQPALGRYSAAITASKQQGTAMITATDSSSSPPFVAQSVLVQSLVGEVHLGRVRRRGADGTAELKVRPPGEGIVTLAGGGIVDRRASVSSAPVELTIAARGRKARALRRTGRAKVRGEVEFSPDYGANSSARFEVTLIKRK